MTILPEPRDGWSFTYWWLGRLQHLCEERNQYQSRHDDYGTGVYSRAVQRLRDDVSRREAALEAYRLMEQNNPALHQQLIRYGFRLFHRGYEGFEE